MIQVEVKVLLSSPTYKTQKALFDAFVSFLEDAESTVSDEADLEDSEIAEDLVATVNGVEYILEGHDPDEA